MPDYNPIASGDAVAYTASATITGGQVVENTGNGTVGPAGATSQKVVGVAAFDAASGALVTALSRRKVHSTVNSGGLTAGQPVKAAASGQIALYVVGTDALPAYLGICTVGATTGNAAQWVGV